MHKVLITDVKDTLTKVLSDPLSKLGIKLLSCGSLEDLLDQSIIELPSVICIELELGGELELLKEIKKIESLQDVPVLFLSSPDIKAEKVINLRKWGAFDIVQVPLNNEEFASRLSTLVQFSDTLKKRWDDLQRKSALGKDASGEHSRLQSLVQMIPLGVMIFDQNNTLTFMNVAAEILTGYKQEKLQFKTMDTVYETLGFEKKKLGEITTIEDEFYRCILKNKHHREIDIERKTFQINDKNNDLFYSIDMFRDVTTDVEFEKMMEERVNERSEGVVVTQNITMMSLASLAESRDNETGMHLERMRTYSRMIADELKEKGEFEEINNQFVKDIYASSPLHDIGKVGIPDYVLLKPGKLTNEEWEIMKTHPTIGAKTLNDAILHGAHATFLAMARDICACHHEKWDGSGYPLGKKGDDIPLSARIVTLADCYDALRSARVYKRAFTHEESREIIVEKSGVFYDPRVVDSFLRIENQFIEVAERFKDEPPESEDNFPDMRG